MREMGVGRAAKGSAQHETEDEEPDPRTVPRRIWGARPRASGPSTVHTQLSGSASDSGFSPQARPLHSQALQGNSEHPSPKKRESQRVLGADTHLTEPHRGLGSPSRTRSATGRRGSQRASPRPIPSRPSPQVPLNTRSPLPPPAPPFPSPAGAPELAAMRALGTDASRLWSELAPDAALATLT